MSIPSHNPRPVRCWGKFLDSGFRVGQGDSMGFWCCEVSRLEDGVCKAAFWTPCETSRHSPTSCPKTRHYLRE